MPRLVSELCFSCTKRSRSPAGEGRLLLARGHLRGCRGDSKVLALLLAPQTPRSPALGAAWGFSIPFPASGALSTTGRGSRGEGRQSAGHAGGDVAPSRPHGAASPAPPAAPIAPCRAGGLPAAPGGPLLLLRAAPWTCPGRQLPRCSLSRIFLADHVRVSRGAKPLAGGRTRVGKGPGPRAHGEGAAWIAVASH